MAARTGDLQTKKEIEVLLRRRGTAGSYGRFGSSWIAPRTASDGPQVRRSRAPTTNTSVAPRDGPVSRGTREVLEQSINIRASLRSLPFALKNRSSVFAADALATTHRGQFRSGTGGPENETASARRRGAPFGQCRDEILLSPDYCSLDARRKWRALPTGRLVTLLGLNRHVDAPSYPPTLV